MGIAIGVVEAWYRWNHRGCYGGARLHGLNSEQYAIFFVVLTHLLDRSSLLVLSHPMAGVVLDLSGRSFSTKRLNLSKRQVRMSNQKGR